MSDVGTTCHGKHAQQHKLAVARVTIDTMFLLVHAQVAENIIPLLFSIQDQTQAICEMLGTKELTCTAFVDVSHPNLDECILIEVNSRACYDSDMHVFKKHPLSGELFYAILKSTARLCVVHITPFNGKKIKMNGWQYSFGIPLFTRLMHGSRLASQFLLPSKCA
jgi:hypothetical protein